MTALLNALTTRVVGNPAALVCNLCAHRCTLRPGEVGVCGVIVAEQGALQSLVYGRPVLRHADPIERKPLYHVHPGSHVFSLGTVGCTMRCAFCQNWRLSQAAPAHETPSEPGTSHAMHTRGKRDDQAHGAVLAPADVVAAAREQGCAGIAFTYNEPTVCLDYAAEVMHEAKHDGLFTVLKTNGYLTTEAIDALDGLLDAANVDLKSTRDAFYREVCGARVSPVCDAIAHLHRRGVWVEVSTPIIPSYNDSDADLRELAAFLAALSVEIPWHVWRFHPDYRMPDVAWTSPHDMERAVAIGRAAGLRYVYASNTPSSPHQHTHCPHCTTRLIARAGYAVTDMSLARSTTAAHCPTCGQEIAGVFGEHDRG